MNLETPPVTVAPAASTNQATKKNLRGSTLLLAGRIIGMVANFATQVLIVRYLSKSDYGAFAYVMSLVSLGAIFTVFGFEKTITRFVPIYQERGQYQRLFGAIVMMISTICSIGFFLVVLVFGLKGWIAGTVVNDSLAVELLLLMIFLAPIQALDSLLVGMLAVFVSPRAIFFRRYILGAGLRLLVVLLLILLHSNVFFLSIGYVVVAALGVSIYFVILIQHLRNQEFSKHFNIQKLEFPVREIFAFSLPLLIANFVYLVRTQLVVVMLEYFRSTLDVAAFRAVQPVGDLNTVVIQSFAFLFMPIMARTFAREDQQGMDDLYWQSAVWISVMSFPIFLITFSLAEPLTLLLFGERYAESGAIMAVLALGYYFNAALGFNADTLRVHGKLRYTVVIDIVAMFFSLGLNLVLIPRYGALGAAIGTCGTLILYNILNHLGLKFATKIDLFQLNYLRVYISIVLGSLGLALFQKLASPPIYVGLALAVLISLTVLLINRNVLRIEHTFPELLRFRLIRLLFVTSPKKK